MKARYEHLDGLRGLAAANVMLGHALLAFDFALYTGDARDSHASWDVAVSASPLLLPVAGQNFSVAIFLVMSGFVLAHAFGVTGLGAAALAAKRFTRLAIPILAATLFAWALLAVGLMFGAEAVPSTRSAWLAQQMTHGASFPRALFEGSLGALLGRWSYASTYDSSLWTMSIEFAGSLLLIGVFRGRRWLGRAGQDRRVCAAVLFLMGVALYPTYLSLVLLGAAMGLLDLQRLRLPRLVPGALAGLAMLLGTIPYSAARGAGWDVLVALAPSHVIPLPFERFGPAAARMDAASAWHGLAALLLLLAVECSPGLRRWLSARRLGFLGLISFPLYVVHVPVLLSVGCGVFLLAQRAGLPYAGCVGVAILCYAAAALGLATLAVNAVERPAIRAANRIGRVVDRICGTQPYAPFSAPLPSEPIP